jgi:hypothetical protein
MALGMGRVGRGIKAGGKTAGVTAAIGSGAFLRQAASPVPGGTAAMTAALGLIGATTGGLFSSKGGGNGKDKSGGANGGAAIGAGLGELQKGIAELVKINTAGFKDVSIIKDVLVEMRDKAYEEARRGLKNIQGPPMAPILAANNPNSTTAADPNGINWGGILTGLAGIAAGLLLWADKLKAGVNLLKNRLLNGFNSIKNLGKAIAGWGKNVIKFFSKDGAIAKFFGKGGTLATMADDLAKFARNNMMTRVIGRVGLFVNSIGKFIDDMFQKLPKIMRPPRLFTKPTNNPMKANKPKLNRMQKLANAGKTMRTGFASGPQNRNVSTGKFTKNAKPNKSFTGQQNVKSGGGGSKSLGGGGAVAPAPVSGLLSGKSKVLDGANKAIKWMTKLRFLGPALRLGAKLGLPIMIGERVFRLNQVNKAFEAGEITKKERDREAYSIVGAGLGAVGMGMLGTLVGGPVGGIIGSLAGFFGGEYVGGKLYDFLQGENVPKEGPEGFKANSYAAKGADKAGFMNSMMIDSDASIEGGGQGNMQQKFIGMRQQKHAELAQSMGIAPKDIAKHAKGNKRFIDGKAAIDADVMEQYNKAKAAEGGVGFSTKPTTIINEGDVYNNGGGGEEGGQTLEQDVIHTSQKSGDNSYDTFAFGMG